MMQRFISLFPSIFESSHLQRRSRKIRPKAAYKQIITNLRAQRRKSGGFAQFDSKPPPYAALSLRGLPVALPYRVLHVDVYAEPVEDIADGHAYAVARHRLYFAVVLVELLL